MVKDKAPRSKLYTGGGDGGETALFGGRRVPKDAPRVRAYGAVDELNAAVGVAIAFVRQRTMVRLLRGVQNDLLDVGAELASAGAVRRDAQSFFALPEAKIRALEEAIDRYDARVAPLRTFILPSGSREGALLHLARTVCRRAEREVVSLGRGEPLNPNIIIYLNRLSDLLFVLARYANKAAGSEERPWQKP
ncbi:MAG: cob(I)yrinic acid a,c-diamide adenosyltransferase [Dehalococcoidia bacterium]